MSPMDPDITAMIAELSAKANAFRQSILLLTANRFDLFTQLSVKSMTSREIAERLSWNTRAAEVFLNALTALGVLRKEDGRFSNTAISQRLLVKDSPHYQGDILNHNLNLWERWSKVGEVLQSGKPARDPRKRRSTEELRNFISGMANTARVSAPDLWERVDLSGRRKLLDAGGGPGTYAFYACRRYPDLEAIVFDLPEVEPIFNEHRAEFGQKALPGVSDKVTFQAGDLHRDPLPEGCDAVLLSNIIHSWGEEENKAIFRKIDAALPPGSLLIIKDFFISEDGTQPLHAALFAVNMLVGTEKGGCYSRAQVKKWMQESHFRVVDDIQLTEQTGVLVGEKQ